MSEIVSVFVSFGSGTANAGANARKDYLSSNAPQMIVFGPRTLTQWINVPIFGDSEIEPNETFTASLSRPTNVTLGLKQNATVTIIDDDVPVVSLTPSIARALATGPTTLTFTVSPSKAAVSPVSLSYTAVDGTADAGDYSLVPGSLTFATGEKTKTITVTINARRLGFIYPRKFTLTLSNAVNATFSGGLTSQSAQALIS